VIRDAFHRQGPFVGSGGHYSPGPATDTPPFGRWADRSMALSRHRGSSPDPSRSLGKLAGTPTLLSLAAPVDGFTHRRSLRARSPFTRSCRCFCSAITELIRDQTPPDDFCNCVTTCGQPNQNDSRVPRRDDGLDHLPFLNPSRLLPCESGDERRAARRSLLKTPVLVPPACASLPSRDTSRSAPPPPVARRCIARINVHGSKDRVKDASRSACDDVSCLRPVPTLEVA
jgi:hypothetical protein